MRALVVEDEPIIRLLMVETLEDDGFEVVAAQSGVEACELIVDPDHFDVVVTDLNMPLADGISVAKCARAFNLGIPVLFISGRPDLLAGLPIPLPYSFLRKPFRLEEFSEAVERLINRP